jgi:hypothetical protein
MAAVIAFAILVGMASFVKVVGTASAPSRTMESSVAAKIVGHASTRLSSKKIVCHRHAANASTAILVMIVLVTHHAQEITATRKGTVKRASASASQAGLATHATKRLLALFMVKSNVQAMANASLACVNVLTGGKEVLATKRSDVQTTARLPTTGLATGVTASACLAGKVRTAHSLPRCNALRDVTGMVYAR